MQSVSVMAKLNFQHHYYGVTWTLQKSF